MLSSNSPLSIRLAEEAALRSLRLSISDVYKTQLAAPIGWMLVVGLVWSRTRPDDVMVWVAGFGVVLIGMLWKLKRMRDGEGSVSHRIAWLHALAALDGLAWGVLPFFSFGIDSILDNWIVTLLCGVAAVNAPARALVATAYATQLAGLWIPVMVYAALNWSRPGFPQMTAGITIFLGILIFFVKRVSDVLNRNIVLLLENAELTRELQKTLASVELQAATDPLTEQANRREMDRLLVEEDRRRRVDGETYSLLLLDIDHFKRINDQHGHDVGDEVLKAFSRRVLAQLRPIDVLGRTGGEEFTVLLRGAGAESAREIAQRICDAVAAQPLLDEPILQVTVSVGVAEQRDQQTPAEVAKNSDIAVYEAKRTGRNRVCVAPQLVVSG